MRRAKDGSPATTSVTRPDSIPILLLLGSSL